MNPFAKPEETSPYIFEEFPKPQEEVSEYTNMKGVIEYHLKGFNPNEPDYNPSEKTTPVVHPALLQDFKQVLSPQS
jgi:hypothetical protein